MKLVGYLPGPTTGLHGSRVRPRDPCPHDATSYADVGQQDGRPNAPADDLAFAGEGLHQGTRVSCGNDFDSRGGREIE